jgi:hypothetical protein
MHSFFARLNAIWAFSVLVLGMMAVFNHTSVYLHSYDTPSTIEVLAFKCAYVLDMSVDVRRHCVSVSV